jgi:hypothetical protein
MRKSGTSPERLNGKSRGGPPRTGVDEPRRHGGRPAPPSMPIGGRNDGNGPNAGAPLTHERFLLGRGGSVYEHRPRIATVVVQGAFPGLLLEHPRASAHRECTSGVSFKRPLVVVFVGTSSKHNAKLCVGPEGQQCRSIGQDRGVRDVHSLESLKTRLAWWVNVVDRRLHHVITLIQQERCRPNRQHPRAAVSCGGDIALWNALTKVEAATSRIPGSPPDDGLSDQPLKRSGE